MNPLKKDLSELIKKKVYFFDSDNNPIFQYHQSNDTTYVTPDISSIRAIEVGDDFIHILQPIYFSNKAFGKVYLVLSKDFINQWKETQQERIIIFILVTIILAVLFAKSVEPLITNPI